MNKKFNFIFFAIFLGFAAALAVNFSIYFQVHSYEIQKKVRNTLFFKFGLFEDPRTSADLQKKSYELYSPLIAFPKRLVFRQNQTPSVFLYSNGEVYSRLFSLNQKSKILIEEVKVLFPQERVNEFSYNFETGFKDHRFFEYIPQLNDETGWFQLQLENKFMKQDVVFFRESSPEKVIFVESTDTFKAYNETTELWSFYSQPTWLGEKFIRPKSQPNNYTIEQFSLNPDQMEQRDCRDHLINADLVLKGKLEKSGISFANVSDEFLDSWKNLENLDLIIFGAHNEYWTKQKLDNVRKHVERGGSIIHLGGNKAWRWIERQAEYEVIHGSGILNEKDQLFLRNNYFGSYFDDRGLGTSAPYSIYENKVKSLIDPTFAVSSGMVKSEFVACDSIISGPSGHETDKLVDGAVGFHLLGKGINGDNGGAEIVYKAFPNGGGIFDFGSIDLWHGFNNDTIMLVKSFIKKHGKH